MCNRSCLLCDEEDRVAEDRAPQIYCLVSGTQQLPFSSSNHGPQVSFVRRVPLTSDLPGPSTHLQEGYSTCRLEALYQQAPLQKK